MNLLSQGNSDNFVGNKVTTLQDEICPGVIVQLKCQLSRVVGIAQVVYRLTILQLSSVATVLLWEQVFCIKAGCKIMYLARPPRR